MRQTLTYTPHVTLHPLANTVDQRGLSRRMRVCTEAWLKRETKMKANKTETEQIPLEGGRLISQVTFKYLTSYLVWKCVSSRTSWRCVCCVRPTSGSRQYVSLITAPYQIREGVGVASKSYYCLVKGYLIPNGGFKTLLSEGLMIVVLFAWLTPLMTFY